MEDLTYSKFVEFNACSVPGCDKRKAEDELCFDHQQEMEQAQREWEKDKAVDEAAERLYGHPRSAETYEETQF